MWGGSLPSHHQCAASTWMIIYISLTYIRIVEQYFIVIIFMIDL